MSVATIRNGGPSPALFREEQWFGGWVTAALGVATLLVVVLCGLRPDSAPPADPEAPWRVQLPLGLALGLSLSPLLVLGLLRMVTEVGPAELRIGFGLVPTVRHVVPIAAIATVEPVRYRPFRDHGGWGIRRTRGGVHIFTARGDRGVRLTLRDGSTILVGSQCPDELADYLDRAIRDVL